MQAGRREGIRLESTQLDRRGRRGLGRTAAAGIRAPQLALDGREWGYDHGTWSVLKPMFPKADIPVLQLSLDYACPPAEHFALGRQGALAQLADFQKLGQVAQLAHPTHDHYLPLLHAAGAADPGEQVRFFNERYQSAAIAMRSVVWG